MPYDGLVCEAAADFNTVQETDRQHNGLKQWELYGALGAAGHCFMVVSFDRKKGQWVFLLSESANLTEQLDLDGDGEKEIVTRFGAASDVTIYRWKLDHFECVDIAKALGSDYAVKIQQEGMWVIEAGKVINGESQDRHYFKYQKGKLVEVE